MEQRNVTISLPADLLLEARHLAVDQGLSLSKFVAVLVEERVEAARQYRAARERQRLLLAQGLVLGTEGRIRWDRESLYER